MSKLKIWENHKIHIFVFFLFVQLDYKVDEKKLKEVFKLAGKVVSAELSLDKEGKSRGFGVVEYEHPVEAVQAICILCIVLDFIMYSYLSKRYYLVILFWGN
jgi:hypothetical protein